MDKDAKYLGCQYVLGALTIVSNQQYPLPWMYESFRHQNNNNKMKCVQKKKYILIFLLKDKKTIIIDHKMPKAKKSVKKSAQKAKKEVIKYNIISIKY